MHQVKRPLLAGTDQKSLGSGYIELAKFSYAILAFECERLHVVVDGTFTHAFSEDFSGSLLEFISAEGALFGHFLLSAFNTCDSKTFLGLGVFCIFVKELDSTVYHLRSVVATADERKESIPACDAMCVDEAVSVLLSCDRGQDGYENGNQERDLDGRDHFGGLGFDWGELTRGG